MYGIARNAAKIAFGSVMRFLDFARWQIAKSDGFDFAPAVDAMLDAITLYRISSTSGPQGQYR